MTKYYWHYSIKVEHLEPSKGQNPNIIIALPFSFLFYSLKNNSYENAYLEMISNKNSLNQFHLALLILSHKH